MKYHFKNLLLSLILITFISGCTGTFTTRYRMADALAEKNGFQSKIMKGGRFWLQTYQKITDSKLPYVVYLEGDGFAFKNKFAISDDPTPLRPTVLKLAVSDYRSNVIYVARPCQYVGAGVRDSCDNAYWTRKRLAPEVIDSINEVIKNIAQDHPIDLVGFSSGGGAAVLVASRNDNVRSIITIAGLLDHKLFTEHHRVLDMIGSMNPIDVANKISNIPQIHLSGGRDTIIRPSIADAFIKASNSKCIRHEIIPDATHNRGWQKVWGNIINNPPTCRE